MGTVSPFPRRKVAQGDGAGLTRDARQTLLLRQTLPRGITIGHRKDGRDKPWFVRFGASRTVESFATEKARNDRANALDSAVEHEGRATLDFDPTEWRQWKLFKERTGVGPAEAEAIVSRVKGALRQSFTVAEAVPKYRDLRKAEGLKGDSLNHVETHLRRLVAALGHLPLFAVTAEHIRGWLAAMPMSPLTVRHHLVSANTFFARAVLEKWAIDNPCLAVVPPKIEAQDTTVLSARDVFALLKANAGEPVVGRLVLELFGGLRCSSVERILPEHIRMDTRGIEMPGAKHKSGKRKFRQGHPPVLWAWLEYCWPLPQPLSGPPFLTGITESGYDDRKKEAFVRAGVNFPHNVLRHSCASYLLALTKDPPKVAYLFQHTSLKMLERYEGVADENDARLVMAMTPAAVMRLTVDEFFAQTQTQTP